MMIIIKCGDTFPKSCSLYSKDVDHCCLEALKTSKVHLLSGMKIEVFKSMTITRKVQLVIVNKNDVFFFLSILEIITWVSFLNLLGFHDDFTAYREKKKETLSPLTSQTFYHGTRSWMVVEAAPYLTWWKLQVVQQKHYNVQALLNGHQSFNLTTSQNDNLFNQKEARWNHSI